VSNLFCRGLRIFATSLVYNPQTVLYRSAASNSVPPQNSQGRAGGEEEFRQRWDRRRQREHVLGSSYKIYIISSLKPCPDERTRRVAREVGVSNLQSSRTFLFTLVYLAQRQHKQSCRKITNCVRRRKLK
jgi:hypothetical protein